MNLMDLLSNEPGSSMYAEDGPQADTLLDQRMNIYDYEPDQRIYYLPTVLTRIQKELLEVMIQIFSADVLNEIHSKKLRGSINSLLDNATSPATSSYDKLTLLFDQLMIIDKHPSLLVDHFIPKKLLLLETNEKLSTLAGKFLLFNKLVDTFIDEATLPFHVLVVAPSIKELELIESLVIGKKMYYKNLSSNKLYEDNRDIPDLSSSSFKVCLYLITSQQLYNNYLSSSDRDTKFNLIFSFDMKLDISSPSIEFLKSESKYTTILIPIPIYSLEHIILQIPEPPRSFELRNDEKAFKWKVQVLNTLIVNRFNIFEDQKDFFIQQYGGRMSKILAWMKDGRGKHFQNLMKEFDEKLVLNFSDDKVIKKVGISYLSKEVIRDTIGNYDYKLYRATLAQYFNNRVIQLEEEIQKKYHEELPALRNEETERQTRLDDFNDQIGDNYRKLRRLNEDAGFAEKKLARADVDLLKKQQIRDELQKKLDLLKEKTSKEKEDVEMKTENQEEIRVPLRIDVTQEGNESEVQPHISEVPKEMDVDVKTDVTSSTLQGTIKNQQQLLEELSTEIKVLSDEYDKINEENDNIRLKYQTSSSEAVQLSTQLAKLKEQNSQIEQKLNGPGMRSLPQLIKKDAISSYEAELSVIRKSNAFIASFFRDKLDKVTKERQGIIEATASGSSSRPSNRISRATTPL